MSDSEIDPSIPTNDLMVPQEAPVDSLEPAVEIVENTVYEIPVEEPIPVQKAESDIEEAVVTSLEPNLHVTYMERFAAVTPDKVKGFSGEADEVDFLSLPNEITADLEKFETVSNKEVSSQVRTVDGVNWIQDISRSAEYYNVEKRFEESVQREDSDWKQFVEHETKYHRGGENKLSDRTPTMNGSQAVKAIRSALNLSNSITKPLWNSGIWVHMEAPSDLALLNLDRAISHYLEDLGYKTLGLVYSNEMVHINNLVVNLAIDHITHSSLADHSPENLRKVISVHDIGLLASYLCLLSYPNGYKTRRPCINTPTSCTYVFEGLLNIKNIWYVDNNRLTVEEKRFVTDPKIKHTVEEILNYQSAINAKTKKNVFSINNNVRVVLKTPQIEGYSEHGNDWTVNIASMVDGSAIKTSTSVKERNDAIGSFANVSRARNYSHYIKEIIISYPDSEDTVIDDTAAIKDSLTEFASVIIKEATEDEPEQTAADLLITKVGEYIDDATIVVIALPKYVCPHCNTVQSDGYDAHPHLITVDAVRIFFTLVARKSAKAS